MNDLVSVFDDLIVTCRPKHVRGHAYDAIIHVPKQGNHHLKIEAVKTTFSAAAAHRREQEEITWFGSLPLDPGSNHSVEIYGSTLNDRKIWIKLNGRKSKLIDFPFDYIASTGTLDLSHERTIMSPNQYSAIPKSDQSKFWFGSVLFYPESNGSRGNRDVWLVRLAIESDGPATSLPEDLMVVRKLLADYEAGKKPKFVFNADGLYEFNRTDN